MNLNTDVLWRWRDKQTTHKKTEGGSDAPTNEWRASHQTIDRYEIEIFFFSGEEELGVLLVCFDLVWVLSVP